LNLSATLLRAEELDMNVLKTFRRHRLVITIALAVIGLAAAQSASAADGPGEPQRGPADKPGASVHGVGKPIPGHYIVMLREGENPRSVMAIANVKPTYVYESAINGFAAELNDGQVNALRHLKAVESIEQDQETTGDSYSTQILDTSGQPWGVDRIDQRSGLSRSFSWWAYGAGNRVSAYVIDSGIATGNADFGGRAQNLYDAFGGNGQDCHGHGTHVAGTLGGFTYGVAKSVMLRGIRVLNCQNRGTAAGLIAGVDWVRLNARKPAVANISIGLAKSTAVNTAVANLVNSGVFVAVAAGNSGQNACNHSPASAAGTVTVAASDWYDNRVVTSTWSSNYGACVDLYAPGQNIKSTYLNGGTNTMGGTSMATPHVTGVAALIKSDYGDQPSSTVLNMILNAATVNVVGGNVAGTPNRLLFMSGW
jgi:subtilisin family serine protease